jgi:glycosyltransferase involved in cell wall biosynthesis
MIVAPSTGCKTLVQVIQSVSAAVGGPPVSMSLLSLAFVALGHRVHVLAEDADGPDAVTKEIGEVASVHKVPRLKLVELFHRGKTRRKIADLLEGADLVYLHGVWDPLLLVTAMEAWAARIPYVVTPHGMLDPWSLAQKRLKKWLVLTLFVRRMLTRASAIRALNQDEAELIRPLKLSTSVRVIPNGVDLTEVNPATSAAFNQALPGLGGRPYILFLSRLHYKKGLDYLADAFARIAAKFPHLQLLVAGPDGGNRGSFEGRVSELGLTARVHLPGPLYGPIKWAALTNCVCFCLPSRQEGFSIAILEALASQRPVVISEACHFPEVAEAGAGVVSPLTAEAVANGLEQVLSDPAAAKAMGEAGRRLVEERYTWAKVAAMCGDLEQDISAGRK